MDAQRYHNERMSHGNNKFLCETCFCNMDRRFVRNEIPKLSDSDDLETLARYMSWLFRSPYSYHLDEGIPAWKDFAVDVTKFQYKTLKANDSTLQMLEGYFDTDIWELYTAFSVTEFKTVQNDVTQKVYSKWGDDNILLTRDWKEYDFQDKWQEIYDRVEGVLYELIEDWMHSPNRQYSGFCTEDLEGLCTEVLEGQFAKGGDQ